jgi:hypothetical protein
MQKYLRATKSNNIKGKKNKIAKALNKRKHLTYIRTYETDKKETALEALVGDTYYLQIRKEISKVDGKIQLKYEQFELVENGSHV